MEPNSFTPTEPVPCLLKEGRLSMNWFQTMAFFLRLLKDLHVKLKSFTFSHLLVNDSAAYMPLSVASTQKNTSTTMTAAPSVSTTTLKEIEEDLCYILDEMTAFSEEIYHSNIVKKEVDGDGLTDENIIVNQFLEKSADSCNQSPNNEDRNSEDHLDTSVDSNVSNTLKCLLCDKTFAKQHHLNLHIRLVHERLKRKKSKPSLKVTPSSHLVNEQLKPSQSPPKSRNRKDANYCCEICGLQFSLHSEMSRHKRKIHAKSWKCRICDSEFTTKLSLIKHKNSVHPFKKILCPICGKQFNFKSLMEQHQRSKHSNLKFPCETCGKEFATKLYLMKHSKEVHDGQRPKYLCTICGKHVFILKSHMESVHLGVKYPCEKCGKEFATPPGLKVHILTFHEGNKYPCLVCGKIFNHKGYLKNHVDMVHKGKKFPCKECGLEFKDSRLRRQHVETAHQGKKHSCSICKKEFTRHDHLMRHKQSVHEGRRYPCLVCGKEFSQSGDLKRHSASIHQYASMKEKAPKACSRALVKPPPNLSLLNPHLPFQRESLP